MLEIASGLIAIIVGIFFILLPRSSVYITAMIIGAFLVVYGILRVAYGIKARSAAPAPVAGPAK
jgi:uncharacterized membrane protein HdeD (DUF308 family)